jgi:hypothetical protein
MNDMNGMKEGVALVQRYRKRNRRFHSHLPVSVLSAWLMAGGSPPAATFLLALEFRRHW